VAGGPSLKDFNYERLRGEKTIAINVAYMKVPWADALFMMDSRLYRWITVENRLGEEAKKNFCEFKGYKVFLDILNRHYPDMLYVRSCGRAGLSSSIERGLCHGNNTGVGALNLAVCLGANPIYLLGYDMKHNNGQAHWHNYYPVVHKEPIVKTFIGDFEIIAPIVKEKNIQVINLNPDSALRCFPFGDINQVLGN
jgi:hypothetical protein